MEKKRMSLQHKFYHLDYWCLLNRPLFICPDFDAEALTTLYTFIDSEYPKNA